jgi:chromosome segregation ATPase
MIGRYAGILLHEETENIFEKRIIEYEKELRLLNDDIHKLQGRSKKLRGDINYLKKKIKEEKNAAQKQSNKQLSTKSL